MASASRNPTDWDAVGRAAHDAYVESFGAHESRWEELSDREQRAWVAASGAGAGVAAFLRARLVARGGT